MPDYPFAGFNYRMTDIQGAIGVVQMEKLREILVRRTTLAQRYDQELRGIDWLVTPYTPEGYVHGYQSYVCLFRPEEPTMANVEALHELRNTLMTGLEERGIATRPGTQAVHALTYYQQKYAFKPIDFSNAYLADRLSLALPLYPQMTVDELEYVATEIKSVGERVLG